LIKHSFLLYFPRELLMSFLNAFTSNPGYDKDDTSCPLKNNGVLFHKAKNLNLTCIIKNLYKAKNLNLCELCQNESCL
jgi:hypothetical protein